MNYDAIVHLLLPTQIASGCSEKSLGFFVISGIRREDGTAEGVMLDIKDSLVVLFFAFFSSFSLLEKAVPGFWFLVSVALWVMVKNMHVAPVGDIQPNASPVKVSRYGKQVSHFVVSSMHTSVIHARHVDGRYFGVQTLPKAEHIIEFSFVTGRSCSPTRCTLHHCQVICPELFWVHLLTKLFRESVIQVFYGIGNPSLVMSCSLSNDVVLS